MIILKENINIKRDEIHIHYHSLNKNKANQLYHLLKNQYHIVEVTDKNYNKKIEFLNKIYYIQSADHKIQCYFEKDSQYMNIKSIRSVKNKLRECGFIQINKSTYINKTYIQSYKIIESAKRSVQLSNGKELIISRRYKDLFEQEYIHKK